MYVLRALGGASIERAGGAPVRGAAAQRHRIALLVRLAAAPDRSLPRETLAGLLWPEHAPREARHLLNVSVHALRRALGEGALRSEGRALRLDTDLVACDLVRFRETLERGDVDEATRLYAGPFLDGFFLDHAPGFDQWQEMERARVARELRGALEAAAEAVEARGDVRTARDHWRRLVEHEPYTAAYTVRLMRALEAIGDPGRALQAAEEHRERMAEAFEAEPHPDVAALAERMRARPHAAALAGADNAPPAPAAPAASNRELAADAPAGLVSAISTAGAPQGEGRAPPARRRGLAFLVAAAATAFLVATVVLVPRGGPADTAPGAPPPLSVAVLPFQDFSEGGRDAYLSDGITEELRNALAGIRGLHVPARSSSFQFRDGAADLGEVARLLNVAHVLEGSVRREGERVRVIAQLIDAETGYHLWSGEFDRPISDLLVTEEEIARAIAAALRVELERQGAPLMAHADADPVAYDLYLQGRWNWNRRTPASMSEALGAFQEAVARDPDYAAAWAGLADTWQLLPDHGALPAREGLARAKTAALRAVALDSTFGEAFTSLAAVLDDYDRDRRAAGEAYRRAIRLDPSYATARQWYGLHLANGGHFDQALIQLEGARRLDPLSPIINTAVGAVRYFARDWDGAVAEYRAVVEGSPGFPVAWALLGRVYLVMGRVDEAVAALRRSVELSEGDASNRSVLAAALATAGQVEEARAIVADVLDVPPGSYVPYCELAAALLRLDDVEEAMALFERGWEERDPAVKHLYVEPLYDRAIGNPRFDALVAQLGLPEA